MIARLEAVSYTHLDVYKRQILAFVANYAAYFAEIFRGGIQSISRGQYEGAKVLGLSLIHIWQTRADGIYCSPPRGQLYRFKAPSSHRTDASDPCPCTVHGDTAFRLSLIHI